MEVLVIDWKAKGNPLHIAFALLFFANALLVALWPALQGSALRDMIDPYYYFVCHRMSSRCYQLGGEPMLLCVRCVGIFTGTLVASLGALFLGTRGWPWRYPIALALTVLMYGDWLLGYLTGASHHIERLVTGFLGGVGIYMLITLVTLTVGHQLSRLFERLRGERGET